MTILMESPAQRFYREMAERAVRFAPYRALRRIDPDMPPDSFFERRRPALFHEPGKAIEQLLAEEMAYFDVPLEGAP